MDKVEKLAGVWLDHHEAFIVANHDGRNTSSLKIVGKVTSSEHGKHGSEIKVHNAKDNALHKFFHEIMEHLTNTEELVLMGTGIAQEQLIHYLANEAQWKKLKVTELPTDKMNAEQALHKASEYFQHRLN